MASFKDLGGNEWIVSFNIGNCRRLLELTKLDFANAHDGKAVSEIQANDSKMVQVLWLLIEEQAKAKGIDEDAFWQKLDGNVLEEAQNAIEEAVLGFTRPERRAALKAILDKKREAIDKAMNLAVAKVQAVNIDQELEKQLSQSTFGS